MNTDNTLSQKFEQNPSQTQFQQDVAIGQISQLQIVQEPMDIEPQAKSEQIDEQMQEQNSMQEQIAIQEDCGGQQDECEDNEYGGYEEYNEYGQDEYNEYGQNDYSIEEDSLPGMQKRNSSNDNKQYQMEDLLKIIQKQLQNVQQLTGFESSWALFYFESCGWKQQLVMKFIDENQTHLKLIHFIPNSKILIPAPNGICDICCLGDQLMIQNLCGHAYCLDCWKMHLKQKLKTFNKDPFPPCINEECKNRVTPEILDHISSNDSDFRRLYTRTLCRSYAYGNPYVKLCKGRKGFSCDTCFKVKKMFELLQCQECGNFICAKCGDEYHQPSECFDNKNWAKLADEAFVNFEMNNATACPTCKQLIHKYVGCNYIKCICKQEFCYVCGEKWVPNHQDHFVCYRAKEMGAMLAEKQKKLEDEKMYLKKLEDEKVHVRGYEQRLRTVEGIDVKQMEETLVSRFKIFSNDLDYLRPLKKALSVAILIQKSIRIANYFNNEQAAKLCILNIQEIIKQVQDFLLVKISSFIHEAVMLEKQDKRCDVVYYKGGKVVVRDELKRDRERMMKNMKFLEKRIKEL